MRISRNKMFRKLNIEVFGMESDILSLLNILQSKITDISKEVNRNLSSESHTDTTYAWNQSKRNHRNKERRLGAYVQFIRNITESFLICSCKEQVVCKVRTAYVKIASSCRRCSFADGTDVTVRVNERNRLCKGLTQSDHGSVDTSIPMRMERCHGIRY